MAVENPAASEKSEQQKSARSVVPQSVLPNVSLELSLRIPRAISEHFAGKGAPPPSIAMALDMSPTSGTWRNLCGAATAFGLTDASYGAKEIGLAPLGLAIAAPTYDGEDRAALAQAALTPSLMKAFYEKYNRAKLPSRQIGANVLFNMGIPKDRSEHAFDLVVENGRFVGFIQETKTGPFVSTEIALTKQDKQPSTAPVAHESEDVEDAARRISGDQEEPPTESPSAPASNNRVYISHGHHRQVVEQLIEILRYGRYEPVVSVDKETSSIPVPDKVMEDMRSCSAGIINVHSEGEWEDLEGHKHTRINENVLIEIGAVMALYVRRYVLLVQKGIELPSNLQGLYRCEYTGDTLDYAATMKLLKIFSDFA